jgi:hypothetical protein
MASSYCYWLRTFSLTTHSVTLFHAVRRLVISCFPPLWNRDLAHLIEFGEIWNGLLCAPHLLCHEDTIMCNSLHRKHAYINGHFSVQLHVSSPKLFDDVFRLCAMLAVYCTRFQDQCNVVHIPCNQITYVRFNTS